MKSFELLPKCSGAPSAQQAEARLELKLRQAPALLNPVNPARNGNVAVRSNQVIPPYPTTAGLLTLCFVLLAVAALGQTKYRNVLISNSNSPEEPTIVVNPNDTLQMVAGANINGYYFSTNGGTSWVISQISSPLGVYGDPCVVVDNIGSYYYFHLADLGIVCQRLTTLHSVWSSGVGLGINASKFQDKPWAAIDLANNRLYAAWTQFDVYGSSNPSNLSIIRFSSSIDGGLNWSTPVRLNKIPGDCIDQSNTVEGAVPAIGPNGEIYVAWSGPVGIAFNRSLDGGANWLETETKVADQPGGWYFSIPGLFRCNGFPVTACDKSTGRYRGTIYVSWSDQRNGTNNTDVWICKSTDQGNQWTPPRRVNDDSSGRHQFFPWMTVDQVNGNLYVVFYDRRNYDNDSSTDVYLASSKDGGDTFDNTRISASRLDLAAGSGFLGDYINISAHNGVVRPIWTRTDGIWTAIIDPPPSISSPSVSNGTIQFVITNLTTYLTNYVERSSSLGALGEWNVVDVFTGSANATNWSGSMDLNDAYYRVSTH